MRSALALAVLTALGVTALSAPAAPSASEHDRAGRSDRSDRPVTSYLHDVSKPIPGVTCEDAIVEQHRVRMADGTELDTWIVRPRVPEPVPVVLRVTPYYGGGKPTVEERCAYRQFGEELVPRGYAFGIVSVRGTGNSGGCFTIGGPTEARDTARVVEYFARQYWSNGNVGLIGKSYAGTTPQDVWVEAPPHLKTVVPIAGISDLYKYNFVNGVHIDPQGYAFNAYYWALVGLGPVGLTGGAQWRDPVHVPGAVVGEACTDQLTVQEGGASSAVDGNKDAYWQNRDFLAELRASWDRDRASVFYVHGLEDWNVKPNHMDDWLRAVQATGVPFKALLGQWGHVMPPREDWTTLMVAWFDRFLKERDTGILDAPAVQVEDDRGMWRHERRWPSATSRVRFFPAPDHALSTTPTGVGSVSYQDHHGTTMDREVFTSAPLDRDLHLSDTPRFEATVTASGRRANLVLTLAERTPSGDLKPFNYAALSLNHAEDLSDGKADVSGLPQHVAVSFFPQDDVVEAGNRLVLIASGNVVTEGEPGPSLRPVATGSTITIDLAGAELTLPTDRSVDGVGRHPDRAR